MKYHVKSSIVINASLKKIQSYISTFEKWNTWSPWTIVEPKVKHKTTGKPGTIGHKMSWDGKIIGSGTNTISEIGKNSFSYDLEFKKPFKSHAKSKIEFKKVKKGIKVTWSLDSSMPFYLFFMIKSMKAWIEMDYARGLKMLKAMAEDGKIKAKTTNMGVKKYKGFSYIGIRKTSTMKLMPKDMQAAFGELVDFVVMKNKTSAKHWISVYEKSDIGNKMFTYVAAVSDEKLKDITLPDHFVRGKIKNGKMLEIKHQGSYDYLGNAWSMGSMTVRAKKTGGKGYPFEYYWNSPFEVTEEKLKTSVFFPVK
ncbi:MAG: SRPBCC family protein [Candidatus Gracilibacteria bacterium]|nr:SRPBCC family protein [Candidatus Gracilibacteria bacterium]